MSIALSISLILACIAMIMQNIRFSRLHNEYYEFKLFVIKALMEIITGFDGITGDFEDITAEWEAANDNHDC